MDSAVGTGGETSELTVDEDFDEWTGDWKMIAEYVEEEVDKFMWCEDDEDREYACVSISGGMNGVERRMRITTRVVNDDDLAAMYEATEQSETALLAGTVRKIMDTGCSLTMSDVEGRLEDVHEVSRRISGMSGPSLRVSEEGTNEDGVTELRARGMQPDLVLLSGKQYASMGLLLVNGKRGSLVKMTEDESNQILDWIAEKYPELLKIKVVNGVYEVVEKPASKKKLRWNRNSETLEYEKESPTVRLGVKTTSEVVNHESKKKHNVRTYVAEELEEEEDLVFALTATTFFNAKMRFNNTEEVILAYMMMGFSFKQLKVMVQKRTVTSLDKRLTVEALREFEELHGTSPDVFQRSFKKVLGNVKSDEGERLEPKEVGDYVQIDTMYYDFNRKTEGKTDKMPTLGGATGAKLTVDAFSGFFMGDLVRKGTKSEDILTKLFDRFRVKNHSVKIIGGDAAEVSQSELRLFTTEDLKLIANRGACFLPAESHNHSNGGQYVENGNKLVKQKMRLFYQFAFGNPNIEQLGWTVLLLSKLWGEAFFSALYSLNLTECPHVPGKSRYEVFMRAKPDLQQIRMLPIFSVVMAWNYEGDKDHLSSQPHWVHGLYCGPHGDLPLILTPSGVIRVAVKTEKGIRVVATSKYQGVTVGGNLVVSAVVDNGVRRILEAVSDQGVTLSESTAAPRVNAVVSSSGESESRAIADTVRETETGTTSATSVPSPTVVIDTREVEETLEDESETNIPATEVTEDPRQKLKNRSVKSRNEVKAGIDAETKVVRERLRVARVKVLLRQTGKPESKRQIKRASERLKRVEEFAETRPYKTGAQDRDRRRRLSALKAELIRVERMNDGSELPQYGLSAEEWRTPTEDGDLNWYDLDSGDMYYSLRDGCLYTFEEEEGVDLTKCFAAFVDSCMEEEGFAAVTKDIPKNFAEALVSPIWGDAARKEIGLLKDKVIVKVTRTEAEMMMRDGCDIVRLFPVYEEKVRDGEFVRKVRMVADGRTHKPEGATYAATPSREEFLIYLHLIASLDMEWCHVDESRAFTGATHTDGKKVLIKIAGDPDFWKVINALYGLRTAPLDYQKKAAERLRQLGFQRKSMSTNVFLKDIVRSDGTRVTVWVYCYVDDYFFACEDRAVCEAEVNAFREIITATGTGSTEPLWNPPAGLGMEFERDRESRVILIRMKKKITEVVERFIVGPVVMRKRRVPISSPDYIVRDTVFEELEPEVKERAEFLDAKGINEYLGIVGCLLWILGVRGDIAFGVLYLTWFTHLPRQHHMYVARRLVMYLHQTIEEPLVLGGRGELEIVTQTDAALGTGPKCRSVIAEFTVLGEGAGAIHVKATATQSIPLSSFEAELCGTEQALEANVEVSEELANWDLEGVTTSFKTSARVGNTLSEFGVGDRVRRVIWGDNEKAIQFVKGEVEAKNLRHANLRLWYMRKELATAQIEYKWISGKKLDVNGITKAVGIDEVCRMRWCILGHRLLGRPEPTIRSTRTVGPLPDDE